MRSGLRVCVRLSVSSNGSTWVKLMEQRGPLQHGATFSILERIDVGETQGGKYTDGYHDAFQYPRTDRRG